MISVIFISCLKELEYKTNQYFWMKTNYEV